MSKLTSNTSIHINAPVSHVWKALIDPAMIKQYLFGTDAKSDWKKGSDITYTGEWEGKSYRDRGKIIDIVPEKLMHTTYWSSMSGKEDKPENYAHVIYKLEEKDDGTLVSITQDNIEDEKGVQHMNENWNMVLQGMKKVVEDSARS